MKNTMTRILETKAKVRRLQGTMQSHQSINAIPDILNEILENMGAMLIETDEIVRGIQAHEQAHIDEWHTGTILERKP